MIKFNKKLIRILALVLVLHLVTPLLAFAKSGNSLSILSDNSEAIVDYWKISNDSLDNPQKLIESYEDKSDLELNEEFGEKSSAKVMDGKNSIEIDNLSFGTYLFRQEKSEKTNFIPFIISIDENTISPLIIIPKKKPNDVILRKIDKDSKSILVGVGFKVVDEKGSTLKFNQAKDGYIYDEDGKLEELFTNDKGQIKIIGLSSKIKFVETSPLNGYLKNKGEQTAFLKQGDTIDFENEKDQKTNIFSFIKIDGDSKKTLEGAVFKVQKKSKKAYEDIIESGKIYTLTSDTNGQFKTKELPYGDYRLIEIKTANKDYILKDKPIEFKIGETSHQEKIYIKNYKGDIPPTVTRENGSRQRKKTTALVKTGDSKILIIFIIGLILIGYGIKTVRAKD